MSILDGLDETTLRARLTALQTAYLDLVGGAKIVTASYTQGDGSRTVSYSQANIGALTQAILAIQKQLGMPSGRVPIRPLWRARS